MEALHVGVRGLVQGVGFRPFVHRLAARHALHGWVRNASGAVDIHVEGERARLDNFVRALRDDAPVLARIEALEVSVERVSECEDFEIVTSAPSADDRLPVSPDVATCAACAAELADPANRRYRYPFITCTDCGPRFTVIESMPYDRERTSMRRFAQCPECQREYTSPGDRRYHSETNSCPACGPMLWYVLPDERVSHRKGERALSAAVRLLRDGGILALRGLGGFHLAVDATNDEAVRRLRERKHREAKPLAVMVRGLEEAEEIAGVTDAEEDLLGSSARPVVLLKGRGTGDGGRERALLADSVAPGLQHIGVMLAYTPLHSLLLGDFGRPLVMTSGNASDEPIATATGEALERLRGIADGFLMHDREIVARYDDSVVRVVDEAPVFLRRARGYAPMPINLPLAAPAPLLAVGPHLKNTFTLVHGRQAWVSQHIGDLENIETVEHFRASLERFQALFNIQPQGVVHDRHPGYLSTRLARESGLPVIAAVQHHHAHIAAVLAEHGRSDPVIGVAYDGTGYGDDGNVWGAEVLFADLVDFRRMAHLRYAPLPGGDAAARSPWRVAAGYLSLDPEASWTFAPAFEGVDGRMRLVVERQLQRGVNVPLASSMGRLFDAAAALIGVRRDAQYEGQAAMELEALAGEVEGDVVPYAFRDEPGGLVWDPMSVLTWLGEERLRGVDPAFLAASFHDTIVAATVELTERTRAVTGCHTAALGGGCFQNARLLHSLRQSLVSRHFEVLVPRQLSPNDGAVSVGQAAIGAAILSGRTSQVRAARTAPATHGG